MSTSKEQSRSALQLSSEEMRALGNDLVELLVEHFTTLRDKPVARNVSRFDLEERLREPPPLHGTNPHIMLRQLHDDILRNVAHSDHPRFFAFVPGPSNFISVIADVLTSGFNIDACTWLTASGPTEVELVVIDWLRQLCGLPVSSGGLLVSGGSMANLTALAVARHVMLKDCLTDAVIYCSDQTHSSVERGLRVLGFSPAQIRKLPSDADFRLPIDVLREVVIADRTSGKRPFCVVANAGTTNTGAVDPLDMLADFCAAQQLWFHVDGAYGAAAVLCERGRSILTGLDRADSLAFDPHKWLFQPFEIGCVLLRDGALLRDTFYHMPEYLKDSERDEAVNLSEYGIQLTRGSRALKLWLSLKTFGIEAFREAIERGFASAELTERILSTRPQWEIITPAQMGIITFRYLPKRRSVREVNECNQHIADEMLADGFAFLTATTLRGQRVLRMCTINPRTTADDIHMTIERLARIGNELDCNMSEGLVKPYREVVVLRS